MGRIGLAGTREVLSVTSALAVEAVPQSEADSGLNEPFGPVTKVVEHLRLAPFVAETHHGEWLLDRRAQCLRRNVQPLQVPKPWTSPEPDFIDAAAPERVTGRPRLRAKQSIQDSSVINQRF